MQWWLIKNGDEIRQVQTAGDHPRECGEPWPSGSRAYRMQRRGNLQLEIPNLTAGTWSDNLAVLKEHAVAKVEAERERRQDALLSRGQAKAMIYGQKFEEQRDYYLNGATPNPEIRFPIAHAEMALTGDTLAIVIARFKDGVDRTNTHLYKIEALAQRAKRRIEAATTVEEVAASTTLETVDPSE